MLTLETAGAFRIGADLPVRRLGFGAMRLTGPGVWGPPQDPPAARAVLRRAVKLGVDLIDTAGAYGPGDNERLIREALAPYPAGLVIASKGGMRKTGPSTPQSWGVELDASEAFLRQGVEDIIAFDRSVDRIVLQPGRVLALLPIAMKSVVERSYGLKPAGAPYSPDERMRGDGRRLVAYTLEGTRYAGQVFVGCQYERQAAAAWGADDGGLSALLR